MNPQNDKARATGESGHGPNDNQSQESHSTLLAAYSKAGLFLVGIPPVNGLPSKGPTRKGWNLPYADNNPNGYTDNPDQWAEWLDRGWNIGLAHRPSGTMALDIDSLEETRRVFSEAGLPLDQWLSDPASVHFLSGKPGKEKLIFRLPDGVSLPTVQLSWKVDGREVSIFELRNSSTGGPTVQDVCPPSIHPDTLEPYKLIGDITVIPPIPAELLGVFQNWQEWKPFFLTRAPGWEPPTEKPKPRGRPAKAIDGERDAKAEFNAAYALEDVLTRNGYRRKGVRFIRPGSDSSNPGIVVFDNGNCYSHGADGLKNGYPHDAFDVFRILECGGSWPMAMAWNPDLTKENQRAYMRGRADKAKPVNERTSTVPDEYQSDIPPMPSNEDFYSTVPEAYQSGTSGTDEKVSHKAIHPPRNKGNPAKPPAVTLRTVEEMTALPPLAYRIKPVFPMEGIAAIFGQSGSGKSFLALDMAGAIGRGGEWFGYRTRPGPVVYVALEGEAGMRNRIAAYRTQHGGDSLTGLLFSIGRLDLLSNDVESLSNAIKAKGLENPTIIIDTLNRAAPGADENSSVDMGKVIAACAYLQSVCGGLVVLVHHCGKDATKGMRGHSSLFAALDGAIEVKGIEGPRTWTLTKSKDGQNGLNHDFTLEVVQLGIDEDGDMLSSCVINPAMGQFSAGAVPKLGPHGVKAMGILAELYRVQESNLAAGGLDVSDAKVLYADWCESMRDGMPKNRRYEGRNEAINLGFAIVKDGFVYIGEAYQRTSTVPEAYQTGTPHTPPEAYRTVPPPFRGTVRGTVRGGAENGNGERQHKKPVNPDDDPEGSIEEQIADIERMKAERMGGKP